ncbi:DUF4928 family protein [Noviherbaspirillum sp. CPCC 100848]|uniref:DUF4928 family protein n=1 Tax=Noviherbaspirillum album TaxID=3080276 RepID=A0ABU6JIB1_9BURK|nr:DUF4928 family protein [Noviherbaspirillum sp. CPCC 100848]MEC4723425.1 DUF4928 family protein [Noviherbaspirillum sp. CPCC 100848]
MAAGIEFEPSGFLPVPELAQRLQEYKERKSIKGKGQLAALIFASRLVRRNGLPFDVEAGITTDGRGQVKGLGKDAVQRILLDYGIERVLAEEGGRTSRGSLGNIEDYLRFLNELHAEGIADAAATEAWWVEQAKSFFNAKPFALRFDAGNALRAVVRDLLAQARKRQDEGAGTMFVGAMLQHLVGAKLALALPDEPLVHHGFSVADAPGGRSGDFEIGNASIHVTTTPGEAVMRKCASNLHAGRHPVVITMHNMLPAADAFAAAQGIADKVEVLDAEQFIVANLYELGGFRSSERRVKVESLVDKYNEIVAAHETDPSLRIARD